MDKTRYAMIVFLAMATIGAYAVLATATPAYAGGDDDHDDDDDNDKCKLPNGNPYPGNRDKCPPGLDRD
jgi:hypothetical protein